MSPSAPISCKQSLSALYGVPIGYSGHELDLQIMLAAVALSAVMVERHVTSVEVPQMQIPASTSSPGRFTT